MKFIKHFVVTALNQQKFIFVLTNNVYSHTRISVGKEISRNTDKLDAEQIANEYAPKDTSKVKALKKLDKKAKTPANVFAYTIGIAFTLILGIGMCLAMEIIATGLVWQIVGSIIGVIGIVGMSVNYPIYKKILTNSKNKYAQDIINLANEISNEAE